MSLGPAVIEIEYPESDGKPMGETDLHRKWMNRICDLLSCRYRGQRVYVTSNVLVYYIQGSPAKFVVPDDFVVLDCDPGERRVFKIWDEGKAPDVAFEVTSAGTQREDTVFKTQLYARIGIKEFFLYDPTSDYLHPPLRGFRLDEYGEYSPIAEDETAALYSEELDLLLRLEEGRLVMYDRLSGERLLTESELERAAKEAERAAKEAERGARQAAEARAADEARLRHAAEEELKQLREQLKRLEGE
jgi:Uma2 family endonuclease